MLLLFLFSLELWKFTLLHSDRPGIHVLDTHYTSTQCIQTLNINRTTVYFTRLATQQKFAAWAKFKARNQEDNKDSMLDSH